MKLHEVRATGTQKIWSRCVNTKGAKTFFAATQDEMWKRMQRGERNYSEIIKDAPCHLYFDIDGGDVYASWRKLKECLVKIFKALNIHVQFVVLDSSNHKKTSIHAIVTSKQFLLESPMQGKAFVVRIHSMFGEIPGLDTTIYTRNRCFRLLGNSKFNENRPLRGPWTKRFWINSLVQPFKKNPKVHNLGLKHIIPAPSRRLIAKYPPCVREVLRYIKASDYVWKEDLQWSYVGHIKKSPCPFVGRTHRRNNMWFRFNLGDYPILGCHACGKRKRMDIPKQMFKDVLTFLRTPLQLCPMQNI